VKRTLLKPREAAEQAALSYRLVLKLIHSGELPKINVSTGSHGARWRIDQADLARWLESRAA
jgi:excisionase family DNA binding protein